MENADEDISAFLDPAPLASIATLIGQNLKDPILNKLRGESASSDWTHMTQEQRRTWLIENAIDIQDEDLHSVSGKDWTDLLPTIKYKLENSTEMAIEAETYRNLQI